MNAETWVFLLVACLAVNLTPGPSILLVTSISAARGFSAGLFSVLGMTAGAFIHVVLAASGVAALLATSTIAFAVIQYFGAAYLIYLGIDLMRASPAGDTRKGLLDGVTSWQYFRRGFGVDLLNPKIALFFLAFIPQFLSAVDSPGFLMSVALGSVFLVTGILVNATLAWLVATGVAQSRGRRSEWIQRWIPGVVLIVLGLRLLWRNS